jgi:hypothetical protein
MSILAIVVLDASELDVDDRYSTLRTGPEVGYCQTTSLVFMTRQGVLDISKPQGICPRTNESSVC